MRWVSGLTDDDFAVAFFLLAIIVLRVDVREATKFRQV
jgi:hypothetical protein